jgi:hypothetical protein
MVGLTRFKQFFRIPDVSPAGCQPGAIGTKPVFTGSIFLACEGRYSSKLMKRTNTARIS